MVPRNRPSPHAGRPPPAPPIPGGRTRDAGARRAAVADVFASGGSVGTAASPPGSGGPGGAAPVPDGVQWGRGGGDASGDRRAGGTAMAVREIGRAAGRGGGWG